MFDACLSFSAQLEVFIDNDVYFLELIKFFSVEVLNSLLEDHLYLPDDHIVAHLVDLPLRRPQVLLSLELLTLLLES